MRQLSQEGRKRGKQWNGTVEREKERERRRGREGGREGGRDIEAHDGGSKTQCGAFVAPGDIMLAITHEKMLIRATVSIRIFLAVKWRSKERIHKAENDG